MSDPFFKIRPSKRSNPEARTTLDTVHQHYLSKVKDTGEQVSTLKQSYSTLVGTYRVEQSDVERYRFSDGRNVAKAVEDHLVLRRINEVVDGAYTDMVRHFSEVGHRAYWRTFPGTETEDRNAVVEAE